MKSLIRLISSIFFTISILSAQKVSLTGTVSDSKQGTPLVGANVYLAGTSLGTATNDEGTFTISGISQGSYLVKVTYIGYVSFEDSITINAEDISRDFVLSYTSIQGEEVVVTGQARGQMDAINKQLAAKSLINVVSSDRIQELPDANAAESVARVPGVTIKREGGEGNKVVIRGLSPKYNSITVDGTRLASTDADDRSTDLSMISQYMLDGIEVTKAGTPELDGDVLGGTVNFILKKAKPGLHADIIAQGMNNSLKETNDDNKLVIGIGNRFWKDRIGVFGQLDYENRNRSSNSLGGWYTNPGAKLDSMNVLKLANINLYDTIRKNKRQNQLLVLDFEIPNLFNITSDGLISYSYLNSSIYKDVIQYQDSYALSTNYKNHSSGTNDSQIDVNTRTLKLKQTFFSNLHFDAFMSTSRSTNDQQTYRFDFEEPNAYTESTNNKNIDEIFQISKKDTSFTGLNGYNFDYFYSNELEETFGLNLQYDFKFTKYLAGKIKVGNKFRTKTRTYDKNQEYAPVAAAAGLAGPRDSLAKHFPQILENRGVDSRRMSMWAFINNDHNSSNFMNGQYPMGPVADIDFMMEIFRFFRENFNRYSPGASTIDEYIMHRIHETNSIQYDYYGNEDYSANYAMIDLDIISKVNIIYGVRNEKNKTTYNSWRSQSSALPHWVYTGEEYSYERENEFALPALFVKYTPFSWLTLRYASTKTLTRPNYSSIIPLYEWSGVGNSVDYRTPDLVPGVSDN
ncbi:MAG: carboxypeptidase-like regulatory domain-containing protein, partial [Candidatus Marinimicrobia bacterium]|nr:carboxypeptidase-like regulatory domain-containing protein [Candidatus Neomarinimicrobiota bacterium]